MVVVMPYTVGQVVCLDCLGRANHTIGGKFRNVADRGTVVEVRAPFIESAVDGPWGVYGVLWHLDQVVTEMMGWELCIYIDTLSAPGRSDGAFATMEALRLVVQVDHERAMEDVLRQFERSRLLVEDLRGGNGPAYVGEFTVISWRSQSTYFKQR